MNSWSMRDMMPLTVSDADYRSRRTCRWNMRCLIRVITCYWGSQEELSVTARDNQRAEINIVARIIGCICPMKLDITHII